MDYVKDTIPGISLQKAFDFIGKKKKVSSSVIIAVIDTELNTLHPYVKDIIWKNLDEIPNNGIDDDKNGYVDDVNGWNFLGNPKGENLTYELFEFTRMVKDYEKTTANKKNNLDYSYEDYILARKKLTEEKEETENYFVSDSIYTIDLKKAEKKFQTIIPRNELTIEKLDSLKNIRKDLDEEIKTLRWAVEYEYTIEDAENDLKTHNNYRKFYYNLNYDERKIIGDNPDNILDNGYGNNIVRYDVENIDHSTLVSGIIKSVIIPNEKDMAFASKFKVMPIVAAVYGQAHDKDLALAIRYAVDNGASIINLSIIKEFSIRKSWVFEAIKYAASKDVLIVNGSGNNNLNIDKNKNFYPNDNDYKSSEFTNNFLMVGGSSYQTSTGFKYNSSNYGKINVDVLAPAVDLYTSSGIEDYKFANGTSMSAPIVTGVSALIRSYYPNLRAEQVKQIIMNSGTAYDIKVKLKSNSDDLVPLKDLTKSGKIINAYNALIMADKISKNN